jgi:hypothetical protein
MRDDVYDSDDGELDILDQETLDLMDSEFFQMPDDFDEEEPHSREDDDALDAPEESA